MYLFTFIIILYYLTNFYSSSCTKNTVILLRYYESSVQDDRDSGDILSKKKFSMVAVEDDWALPDNFFAEVLI
jgi:hypothetical protein